MQKTLDNGEPTKTKETAIAKLEEFAKGRGVKVYTGAVVKTPRALLTEAILGTGVVPEEQGKTVKRKMKYKKLFHSPFNNAFFLKTDKTNVKDTIKKVREMLPGKSGITADSLKAGIVVGGDSILKNSPGILAHELGHATQLEEKGTLVDSLVRINTRAANRLAGAGGLAPLAVLKAPKAAISVGAVGAVTALPLIFSEAQASHRGLKLLEDTPLTDKEKATAKKTLRAALATYGSAGLTLPAAIIAYGILRKKKIVR